MLKEILIYVFWITVVFHLDPGGFVHSHVSSIGRTLLVFSSLILAYSIFIYFLRRSTINIFSSKIVRSYIWFISIWLLFYFIWYYGFNYDEFPGVFTSIIRNPDIVFKSFIVVPIIFFTILDLEAFIKTLVYSTIIIVIMFLVSNFTGLELVETWSGERTSGVTRTFMYGYGLINFLIPISISIWFLHFKMHKTILFAFVLVMSVILVTIYRRDMVSVLEYIFIISIISNYVQGKHFIRSFSKYINIRNLLLASLMILFVTVYFPKASNFSLELATGTLGSMGIIESDKVIGSSDKNRMSLTKNEALTSTLKDNFYYGTGFDRDWYTGDGGKNKWEGSDYIFLSSLAMYGIYGLILFLPFYFVSIKTIRKLLLIIKNNRVHFAILESNLVLTVIIGVAAATEIIKNILEYPNWFYPIGAVRDSGKYFIFFSLLVGSYLSLYLKFNQSNKLND